MPLPVAELDFREGVLPLAVALGIGLMLGVERERHKGRGPSRAAAGKISADEAVVPVLAALTTNTVTKAVLAHTVGNRRYAGQVWLGLALVLVGAWSGWALVQALD